MAQLRIALAQINPAVGYLAASRALVLGAARAASAAGAHLLAAPELALTGYPIEDLALRGSFVRGSRAALGELDRRARGRGPWRTRGGGRLPGRHLAHRAALGPSGRLAAERRSRAAPRQGADPFGQAP